MIYVFDMKSEKDLFMKIKSVIGFHTKNNHGRGGLNLTRFHQSNRAVSIARVIALNKFQSLTGYRYIALRKSETPKITNKITMR